MEWGSALRAGETEPATAPLDLYVEWDNPWIHSSCVDATADAKEGTDLEDSWRTPNQDLDWRSAPRPPPGKTSSFAYTNRRWSSQYKQKNSMRTKDGNRGLKYCPGENCHVWLPLHQFATNNNMGDGMDMYCIQCNNHRREEQFARRSMKNNWGGGARPLVVDSFEQFCFYEDTASIMEPPEKLAALAMIDQSILDARIHKGLTIPVNAGVIFSKLFDGNRLHCDVTGFKMTPSCFIDHHAIEFKQNGKRMDIKCTKCSQPK